MSSDRLLDDRAFFMGAKRLAEYRHIGGPIGPRRTATRFATTTSKLLVSLFGYISVFGLFSGVFIIRYHLELMLLARSWLTLICYYMAVALKPDSIRPEPGESCTGAGADAVPRSLRVRVLRTDVRRHPRSLCPIQRPAVAGEPLWKI